MQVMVPPEALAGQQMEIRVESNVYGKRFEDLKQYPAFQAANPKSTARGVNANPKMEG